MRRVVPWLRIVAWLLPIVVIVMASLGLRAIAGWQSQRSLRFMVLYGEYPLQYSPYFRIRPGERITLVADAEALVFQRWNGAGQEAVSDAGRETVGMSTAAERFGAAHGFPRPPDGSSTANIVDFPNQPINLTWIWRDDVGWGLERRFTRAMRIPSAPAYIEEDERLDPAGRITRDFHVESISLRHDVSRRVLIGVIICALLPLVIKVALLARRWRRLSPQGTFEVEPPSKRMK